MNYSFPAVKFANKNTIKQQEEHIRSEFFEFYYESNKDKKIEEAIDLYHSLETLFRILEQQGIAINIAFEQVRLKNEARGYYD